MSNYLAIAAVTMTLRDLLEEEANPIVSGARVTTLRPEKAADGGQTQRRQHLPLPGDAQRGLAQPGDHQPLPGVSGRQPHTRDRGQEPTRGAKSAVPAVILRG
ncbi:MAG: hypothetical protein HZY76_02810 [Anaerolineae bacterium]|nr:MAG: hypothetical protein HZY76_02810 [Anaerolineae bacterium]